MPWWGLLVEVFFVWLLYVIASVWCHTASEAKRGVPEGQRGGVSIVPIIPIIPLAFWGAALLVDLVVGPWGTMVVGWFHVALGFVFGVSIFRAWWCLMAIDNQAEASVAPDLDET